jgi:tRNA-dihydrouridine synthase B
VARVSEACRPTPVTAKIRLGPSPDQINALDVAQAVEGAGGAALTVHGRTAQDMFRGSANWDRISAIKPHLKRIPLIGNGDLKSAQDVVNAFRKYDVDGVMIGRAGLSRPWLFRQAEAALAGEPVPADPSLAEQQEFLRQHFRLVTKRFGDHRGTILMRKYACCYGQGLRGAKAFRRHVAQATTPEQFLEVVRRDFPGEAGRSQ